VSTAWPADVKGAVRRQAEAANALGVPKQLTLNLGNGIELKLILIPAGRFMMGSRETETRDWPTSAARRTNESLLHEVTITRPY